ETDGGRVAGAVAEGEGARLQDEPVLGAMGVGELVHEAGLADAGFPHNGHELAATLAGEGERTADLVDLGVAADEARRPPGGGDVKPASLGAGAGEGVDLHGLGQALNRDRPPANDLHVALGQFKRRGGEQDGPGCRHLLHAGGQMGRLPDRRVVHVQIGADGPDDNLARIEAHADLDGHPVGPEDALSVLRDRLLHPERRVARPDGVVLVGDRRAEQGHDPIAHDLVDGALVAMHCLHHPFEHGIEKLPRFLRVAVGEQLHGTLEVGKEYSDLLALTFNGRLGVDDALGEVLRGVALGRRDTWSRGCRRQSRRMSALRAKLCCRRESAATVSTRPRQRRGTLLAELRTGSVFVLAPRAFHRQASLALGSGPRSLTRLGRPQARRKTIVSAHNAKYLELRYRTAWFCISPEPIRPRPLDARVSAALQKAPASVGTNIRRDVARYLAIAREAMFSTREAH